VFSNGSLQAPLEAAVAKGVSWKGGGMETEVPGPAAGASQHTNGTGSEPSYAV
jgi:hypothetical protein